MSKISVWTVTVPELALAFFPVRYLFREQFFIQGNLSAVPKLGMY
jgi:hypothetical protein